MSYDYMNGKKRIIEVLESKTDIEEVEKIPINDEEFTYQNGIRSWVGALFVDIVNSTEYFKDNKQEHIARIMRAFCSECITILKDNSCYRQIGIRGDCVYAIYSTPKQSDLKKVFTDACYINTFIKMFQKILYYYKFQRFDVGIGLGCSKSLIIKAGLKGSGINDNIWIGDAVIDASKLSNEAGRSGNEPIIVDEIFYSNIKDFDANDSYKYSYYAKEQYSPKLGENVYLFNMIILDFNNWINNNL